jgi:hypothetical protein
MRLVKRPGFPSTLAIGMATALLFGGLLLTVAVAKEVKVGTATLVLPSPQGYCELDTTQATEARAVSVTERMLNTNRLLAFSADCEQLTKYRTSKGATPLDNIAQYQTLVSWENKELPDAPENVIKWVCNQMRSQGEQVALESTAEIKTRAEQVLANLKVNDMRLLGVVGQEPLACYVALLKNFSTEIGTEKTQAVVFAATIVNSKMVYYYLYAPYASSTTVTNTLKQLRTNITVLWAANR